MVGILILALLNQYFIFSGRAAESQDFSGKKSSISAVKPPQSVEHNKSDDYCLLDADNAYFFAGGLDRPQSADIEVHVENPVPVMSLSIQNEDGSFFNRMVYNEVVESSPEIHGWQKSENDRMEISLWCRSGQACDLEAYMKDFPYRETYFAVNNFQFISIPNYSPRTEYVRYALPLRGEHVFYTYVGEGEELAWKFEFKDVGKLSGTEPFQIDLRSGNEIIDRSEYEMMEEKTTVEYIYPGLPSGIYELEIPMSVDTRLISFQTKQEHFGLYQKADMDNHRYGSDLYIVGDQAKFLTVHDQGLQTFYFNGRPVVLEGTREPKEFNIFPSSLNSLRLAKNDITIQTDGLIVPDENDRYFAELCYHLVRTRHQPPDASSHRYLVATRDYDEPSISGDGVRLRSSFDLESAKFTKRGKVKFYLAAPQILPKQKLLKINEITVEFFRPPVPFIKSLLNI